MKNPLVSVVIPVYNGGKYLQKALDSVNSQSYQNIEYVIVNDGSTDETADIIFACKNGKNNIVVLNHAKNEGFVKSLNDGVLSASGKYIARLDADDVWLDPQKIEKQVEFLEKNTGYVLCGGGVVIVEEKNNNEVGRYLFPEQDNQIRKSLLGYNLFAHSSVVFLKSPFLEIKGYDAEYGFFADADLWLKMGGLGKLYNFQEYFVQYLDKEYSNKKYVSRDDQIRRKFLLRCKMKWKYRKEYPGILKAIFLSFSSYIYSFLPLKTKIKPLLFKIRTRLLGSPYHY